MLRCLVHRGTPLAQCHHLLAVSLALAGTFGIFRLVGLLGVERLQVVGVQAERLCVPMEVGGRVVGESAHPGDVYALLVGRHA